MNNKDYKQWEKRVLLVQYIYSQLIKQENIEVSKKKFFENFGYIDADINSIYEYFLNNKQDIIKQIEAKIPNNWAFNRLNVVSQAILIESYSENKVLKTEKKIILDQAIITAKKYCDYKDFEYINAILDKIL